MFALCLTWLVPFVVAFGLYDRTGTLALMRSSLSRFMVVVLALVTGIAWLIINLLLDVLVLVPMSGMTIEAYFFSIGLRYFQIPVICVIAGAILNIDTL